MFDHERSLVKEYQGRPFALLGVDLDNDRKALQKGEKQHNLTWRSWWDEGRSIAGKWKVTALPTLYLIDHKGMVRWQHEGSPGEKELEQLIEQLVKEAESDAGKHAALDPSRHR